MWISLWDQYFTRVHSRLAWKWPEKFSRQKRHKLDYQIHDFKVNLKFLVLHLFRDTIITRHYFLTLRIQEVNITDVCKLWRHFRISHLGTLVEIQSAQHTKMAEMRVILVIFCFMVPFVASLGRSMAWKDEHMFRCLAAHWYIRTSRMSKMSKLVSKLEYG